MARRGRSKLSGAGGTIPKILAGIILGVRVVAIFVSEYSGFFYFYYCVKRR